MIKFYYEIEVKNARGRVTCRRRRLCHSWLEQMAHVLRTLVLSNLTGDIAIDTALAPHLLTGGTIIGNAFAAATNVSGPAGNADSGINVGTGSTAVNATQRALVAPIATGSGAGELIYGLATIDPVVVANPNSDFKLIRAFTNNSGAAITVNEIGLIATYKGSSSETAFFQLARDVLSPGVAVPDGSSLTVRYTVRVVA